jgi:hypothetical protein
MVGFRIGSALSCEGRLAPSTTTLRLFFPFFLSEGNGRTASRGVLSLYMPPFCPFLLFSFCYGYGTQNSVGQQHSMGRMDNTSMRNGVYGTAHHGTEPRSWEGSFSFSSSCMVG